MNAILLLPFLFGVALYIYYGKYRKANLFDTNRLGLGMLAYVFVFSILAIVFYYQPDFANSVHSGSGKTYVTASLYLFVGFLIWLLPFMGKNIGFEQVKISKGLDYFVTIVAISSFIELLMLLPQATHGLNNMAMNIAGIRDAASEAGNLGSGITSIPVLIYSFFNTLLPLTLFYHLAFSQERKKLYFLGIASFVTPMAQTMATGSRDHIVFALIDAAVAYLVFYHHLTNLQKKVINVCSASIAGFIFVVSVWMSIARFTDNHVEIDASFWIYKYLGEGMVNFNTLMFDNINEPCYGDYNFAYIRKILGLRYSESNDIRRAYWGVRLNFPSNLFYTFIGAIVIDWGKTGGLILSMFIARLTYLFIRVRNGVVYFSQLIILHFVAVIVLKGVFFFHLCSLFGGRTIFVIIFMCAFLRYAVKT